MRRLLVLAVVASATGVATMATADETAGHPRIVHIFVVGATVTSVRPVVDAFSRRDASLRLTVVPAFRPADVMAAGEADVAARAWIEVSATGNARLTITDQRATRFLVREVILPTWPDEVARETIVQMVESSVAALLDDDALGLNRAEASSMLNAQERRASTPAPKGLSQSLAAFYQAQLFSSQIRWAHGPGLRWQLFTETAAGDAGLLASVQYVLPQKYDSATIGVRLQTIAARAGAGVERRASARLRIGGSLAGGADVVRIEPQQGSLGVATLTSTRWRTVAVVRAEVRAAVDLGQHVDLGVAASAEWDPSRRRYDVSGTDGSAAVVDPYLVRPGVSVSLGWR